MAAIDPKPLTLRDGRVLLLRAATPDDAPEFMDYQLDVIQTSNYSVTQLHERRPVEKVAERFADQLHRPDAINLLALDGPRIVGGIHFAAHDRQRMRHHGHFGLGVRSTHRGLGLGRALLVTLLDWAAAHPTIEKVCLGCFADNAPALALYRSLGFREESRRMAEFRDESGRYFDDVQMFLWVKPPPAGLNVDTWLARFGPRSG